MKGHTGDSGAGEWRHGWHTLLWTTAAIASGVGLLTITASYFVKPLQLETGWSRGEIALGSTLASFCLAGVLPLVGALADRIGTRKIALISMSVYALLGLLIQFLPVNLFGYYLFFIAITLSASGTSTVVLAQLVARRFVRWRGTVLGLAISGPAILLMGLAPFMVRSINEVSWQSGYLILAAIAIFIGLPSVFLASRKPAMKEASPGAPISPAAADLQEGASFAEAFRSPAYWLLMAGAILSTIPLGGFLHQQAALLSDKGPTVAQVGLLASVYTTAIFAGRTGVGVLLDLLPPPVVVIAVMCGAAAGSLLLVFGAPTFLTCAIAMWLVGSAMGAEGDIQAFFIARQFGMRAFSTIFGSFGTCTVLGFGVGASVFGQLFDLANDYHLALFVAPQFFNYSPR